MLEGPTLKDTYKSAAVEQLSTVPEPWLERLDAQGMTYVGLAFHEDLSKTDYIRSYTPERLHSEAETAQELISETKQSVNQEIEGLLAKETDGFAKIMIEQARGTQISEKLAAKLEEAGLGFAIKVSRDLVPLAHLEAEFGVIDSGFDEFLEPQETDRGLFREILLELNGPGIVKDKGGDAKGYPLADDSKIQADDGVILVPFEKVGEKRLSPVSRKSYASISGMLMDQHKGANYWLNRLIVVDDGVVNLPSQTTGFHSVLLHETGHAMDYLAEDIPELNHRETVDSLYEADLKRAKAGEEPFLTARAADNAREYFAEAVEAYLTQPVEDQKNFYKAENEHTRLRDNNPELYAYVDRLMKFPFNPE
jgi:hypothetical protein